jgi:hypothetical protein
MLSGGAEGAAGAVGEIASIGIATPIAVPIIAHGATAFGMGLYHLLNGRIVYSTSSESETPSSSGPSPKYETTNSSNSEVAIPKDFKEVKEFGRPMGQKVYKKGERYYSRDVGNKGGTNHNGGVWKVFKNVGGKLKRVGTADKNLNVFKD